jgi:hypothetical protein
MEGKGRGLEERRWIASDDRRYRIRTERGLSSRSGSAGAYRLTDPAFAGSVSPYPSRYLPNIRVNSQPIRRLVRRSLARIETDYDELASEVGSWQTTLCYWPSVRSALRRNYL